MAPTEAPDVAVAGLIGAGKSTLVSGLAQCLDATPAPERFEENPYFERFYRQPERWAFQHVVFFLEQSLSDRAKALAHGRGVVQERNVLEHFLVFAREFAARGYLADDDMAVLERLTRTTAELSGHPRLLVYVDISPKEALRRLRGRARTAERSIDASYMQALAKRYPSLLAEWSPDAMLVLPAEKFDFRRDVDIRSVAQLVSEKLDQNVLRADSARRPAGNREDDSRLPVGRRRPSRLP